ncbi:hypothetical protein [Bacillus sp. ISL-45]|uniref:hypothetical protein n=1 Tax=Bacillus sp. ISL-45 TaxID=2819128 RepID=UPI001BEA9DB9|nr:hypothetical protein [Bacillus sp. ISL-45]MBT2662815.1 hypothetical protein [Bacillus sp. ISL-45]
MLQSIALYLSLLMAILLFSMAYIEAIKIANTEGKVHGGTLILSSVCALLFSRFTYLFI